MLRLEHCSDLSIRGVDLAFKALGFGQLIQVLLEEGKREARIAFVIASLVSA